MFSYLIYVYIYILYLLYIYIYIYIHKPVHIYDDDMLGKKS